MVVQSHVLDTVENLFQDLGGFSIIFLVVGKIDFIKDLGILIPNGCFAGASSCLAVVSPKQDGQEGSSNLRVDMPSVPLSQPIISQQSSSTQEISFTLQGPLFDAFKTADNRSIKPTFRESHVT